MSENLRPRVLISGGSGLIGRALTASLRRGGYEVLSLVRRPADGQRGEIRWDPAAGTLEAAPLEGLAAVVHLSGESVAHRWSAARRQAILDSRVQSTSLLARTLVRLERPPEVLLSSSATGYYGARGDELLDEGATPGTSGFLPEVCRRWEEAVAPVGERGIRLVLLRTGVVLSARGGALAQLLTPFRLGAGGVVGSGRQWFSWISLPDEIGAIEHLLRTPSTSGPVNLTAPTPVTNRELTTTLGRLLRRPTLLPLPSLVVRTLFGDMGEEVLLQGQRVVPTKLLAAGYAFQHPELESALRAELGR